MRWRTLVSWIALTAISVALVNAGLLKVAFKMADLFARRISSFVTVPREVVGIWSCIIMASTFVWFQPLLLRLNAWRSIAWVGAVAAAFTVSALSIAGDQSWGFYAAPGICLALPGMALIGWRSRPWMSLIAAALFSAMYWFMAATEPAIISEAFGNPVFMALVIANIPYAAALIYGTELKPKPCASPVATP